MNMMDVMGMLREAAHEYDGCNGLLCEAAYECDGCTGPTA